MYPDADIWALSFQKSIWFLFCVSDAYVIENNFAETKTFFALRTTYVPVIYNEKSFFKRLRENLKHVYLSTKSEALKEISIHQLTDETKLAVGGSGDITH